MTPQRNPQHGAIIRRQLEAKGLTQAEAAAALGIHQPSMNKILMGERTMPTAKIPAASKLLDIDEDVLWITADLLPPDVEKVILRHPKLIHIIRRHGSVMDAVRATQPVPPRQ